LYIQIGIQNVHFDVAITILNNVNVGEKYNVNKIKEILIEEYNKLYGTYGDKLLNLINFYGFTKESKQIKKNKLTIENFITSRILLFDKSRFINSIRKI